MLPMSSAMRCSFFRMSAASWVGGRCVRSSLARGFCARVSNTLRSADVLRLVLPTHPLSALI